MTQLEFRQASTADEADLIALWRSCGLVRKWNDPAKDIAFATSGRHSTILAARLDGKLVASVMVGHDGHRGTVYYVSVDPGHQSKGYGKQVVRAAEDWLKHKGVWKLNLLIRAENKQVRGFYEHLGYQVEDRLCMARKIIDQEES